MLSWFTISLVFGADLFRVDVPDHPEAISTSTLGSTLASPPTDGTPWREEPIPATDAWEAEMAIETMGVGPWHQEGFDGSGVRIAIFDIQWYGVELNPQLQDLPTHDCFGHRSCEQPIDTIEPQFAFETGAHGIACAEVVRSLAPGADIHLVRVNGLTALENAVAWAVREEIDIVSMSMSFFNESFYDGTGSINQQMDILVSGGVLMVTSAGNYARQHYAAEFQDLDKDGRHEFPWGSEYLPIDLPTGDTRINLIWDDYGRCGSTDLDGYIYDADLRLVGRSTRAQNPDNNNCHPTESITARVSEEGWHYLLIHKDSGRPNVRFDVLTRAGTIFNAQAEGSVTDPGSHPHVLTVGAVEVDGYRFNDVEGFSSQGPTNGGEFKPDIAGPDGLTTSVYGPGRFYGTSAATPAVAAAIALLMAQNPDLGPFEAANVLRASAITDGPLWTGDDPGLGAGKAHLAQPGKAETGCRNVLPMLAMLCWLPFGAIRRRK